MFSPEFNLFDQALLLLTGLIAIYVIIRLFGRYSAHRAIYDIYYVIAFAVLLVAGLLLIIFGYEQLDNPLVEVVGVLIPAGLAAGLVAQFYPQYHYPFLAFAVIFLILVALTRLVAPGSAIGTVVLVIVHAVSGLLILLVPILAARAGKTRGAFTSVSLGGILIDAGGMALAFLAAGSQLLFFSGNVVLAILALLLLLMMLAFAYGFVRDIQRMA